MYNCDEQQLLIVSEAGNGREIETEKERDLYIVRFSQKDNQDEAERE